MGTRFDRSSRAQDALRRIDQAAQDDRLAMAGRGHGSFFYTNAHARNLTHLVLQGGGTLGLAHLGFVYGLEKAGVRFAGLAGTSAGAIVALMMACARGHNVNTTTSELLLSLLESMPAATFMDGPYLARRFVKYLLAGQQSHLSEFVVPGIASWRHLLRSYGLHRGHRFETWLSEAISRHCGVDTQTEVLGLLHSVAQQIQTAGRPLCGQDLLHIAATAMPIGLKTVFPRDADWFKDKYTQLSPALWARASMAVPLFFEPLSMELDAVRWPAAIKKNLRDRYPPRFVEDALAISHLHFIDGGMLSNFSIDAFADIDPPEIPTVGVALVPGRIDQPTAPRGSLRAFGQYAGAVLTAMRHLRDREALERVEGREAAENEAGTGSSRRRSRRTRVVFVDTGPHNWLNFNLGPDAMEDLFVRGLGACADFLAPELSDSEGSE